VPGLNRLAALLLALALLAGGLLAAVEVVLVGLGWSSPVIDRAGWYRSLTSIRFSDGGFLAVAAGVALVGLLILLLQLRRWRPTRLPVAAGGWHVQRRSAERVLAGVAGDQPGVVRASVRLRGRRGGWWPAVSAVGDPRAERQVAAAVQAELARLSGRGDRVDVRIAPDRRVA
jgi:hypothetical protein